MNEAININESIGNSTERIREVIIGYINKSEQEVLARMAEMKNTEIQLATDDGRRREFFASNI